MKNTYKSHKEKNHFFSKPKIPTFIEADPKAWHFLLIKTLKKMIPSKIKANPLLNVMMTRLMCKKNIKFRTILKRKKINVKK